MKDDYTKNINFWKRLTLFIEDVQVNDPMSEEEKDMFLNISKLKIEEYGNPK